MPLEVRFGSIALGCTRILFVEFSRPESGVRDLPNILVRKLESVDLPRSPFGQVPVGMLSRDCMVTDLGMEVARACQVPIVEGLVAEKARLFNSRGGVPP